MYDAVVSYLLDKIFCALDSESLDSEKNLHFVFVIPTYWKDTDITKLKNKMKEVRSLRNIPFNNSISGQQYCFHSVPLPNVCVCA